MIATMLELNDDGVGLGLLIIGLVYLIFGATLIFAAYKRYDERRFRYPRWHHKRFMAYSFEFWLGISLVMAVSYVDIYIAFTLLRTPGEITIGWVIFFAVAAIASLAAAKHWARDNLPEVLR